MRRESSPGGSVLGIGIDRVQAHTQLDRGAWGTALIVVLAAAVVGCSLPLPATGGAELIVGYVGVAEDGRCVRRVIPGIDLSVYGPWPGLRLGWSDVLVALPGPAATEAPTPASSDGYRAPFGWQWTDDGGVRHALGWFVSSTPLGDAPTFFVSHGVLGLSFNWGDVSQGVFVGLGRTTILATPKDGNEAFALAFDSKRPCATQFLPLTGGPFDAE